MPSTLSEFRSQFATTLRTTGTVSADTVVVYEFPPGDAAPKDEFVFLAGAEIDQEHHHLGTSREEDYEVTGFVYVQRPGSGDVTASAAEDRAELLLADVENMLTTDATLSSQVFHAQFAGYTSTPGMDDQGRWTSIEFRIAVESHI